MTSLFFHKYILREWNIQALINNFLAYFSEYKRLSLFVSGSLTKFERCFIIFAERTSEGDCMKNESKIYIQARKILRKMRRLDVLILALVVLILFLMPVLLQMYLDIDENHLGVYGDFFGSINAFVSALAFAGLIFTIVLQRRDLQLQRLELQLTREELKRQAEAQENSVKEQSAQVELLKEQINKDIRPYINAYWEFRNIEIVLTVKNIGKCACSDFQIKCEVLNADSLDEENKSALFDFIARIENLRISVFPSSIDYHVALAGMLLKVSCVSLFRALSRSNVSLISHFSFAFRGKREAFSITYDFKTMELFESEDVEFHKDLIKELREIKAVVEKFEKRKT